MLQRKPMLALFLLVFYFVMAYNVLNLKRPNMIPNPCSKTHCVYDLVTEKINSSAARLVFPVDQRNSVDLQWLYVSALCEDPLAQNWPSFISSPCCAKTPDRRSTDLELCLANSGWIGLAKQNGENNSLEARPSAQPMPYQFPSIYLNEDVPTNGSYPCPVMLKTRNAIYALLLHWMEIAREEKIVWWIHFGTLLGAVRHGDLIPYDTDIDIAILSSQDSQLKPRAAPRTEFIPSKLFLMRRVLKVCPTGDGVRLSCTGIPVTEQIDPCSFCRPAARLIAWDDEWLDIFFLRPRMVVDLVNSSRTEIGLLDEIPDGDSGPKNSYTLSQIFPLATCRFMGLDLPCPRDAAAVLSYQYGVQYMVPWKMCDPIAGTWY